jgi:hypothetical protein
MNEIIKPQARPTTVALLGIGLLLAILAALVFEFPIEGVALGATAAVIGAVGLGCFVWGAFQLIGEFGESFVIGERSFGFGGSDLCSRTELPYRIELFDRIERDGSRAVVRLKDGGVIRVPPGLEARLTEMESLLRYHHHLALIGPLGGAGGPVSEQPWNFSNERPIPVPPEGEAIIADPDSLRALLHRYHALAIYQESIPSSFDLARLFTGLHRLRRCLGAERRCLRSKGKCRGQRLGRG